MKKPVLFTTLLIALIVLTLAYNNVSRSITPEDQTYIHKILDAAGHDYTGPVYDTIESEIAVIRDVQDAILQQTPTQNIIPPGETREPKDLFERDYALCGDRSRFMDKALRDLGFETRYASIYDASHVAHPWLALFTTDKSKVRSHAMIEVKTSKGWVMVDSVTRWIALDTDGHVYSLEDWQGHSQKAGIKWLDKDGEIYYLLEDDFTYIYGLYSRHGKFYPPFTPIPDVNWRELLENF